MNDVDLAKLSMEEKVQLLDLLRKRQQASKRNWMANFKPNPKQLEFYAAGAPGTGWRQRMFMASNQSGKTMGAGAEVACHLTGLYPDWWPGLRLPRATSWIAGSESFELNKKGLQRTLLGPPENEEDWGTGAIPFDKIKRITRQIGTQDAVSSIVVKHVSGDDSIIKLASYEQGRSKWQADTVDGVWFDEEPPLDVFMEGLTRTNVSGGPIMLTFTPLLGMSQVVRLFMPLEGKPHPERVVINMTIDDALHYSPERREAIISQYSENEREARAYGRPMVGDGLVFPVSEASIRVAPFPIPSHWPRIAGLDFGWDHPTAVCWCCYDRDTDTFYIYRTYRQSKATVSIHAGQLLSQGQWIPVAWPHDGWVHDKASGKQLKDLYAELGVKMLPKHATFDDADNSNYGFEAGITEMLDRMQTGRFKVFSTCEEFWQEFRGYHRVDGKVWKHDDDVLSAARYAMMMRRHGRTTTQAGQDGQKVKQAMTGGFIPSFGVLDPVTGY